MLVITFCGLLAFMAAAILRWLRAGRTSVDLVLPSTFLLAYWLTYNKIPSFPPVGAVNKIFYLAATGTILGLLIETVGARALTGWLVIFLPAASAAYIGETRLMAGPLELIVAALAGALVLHLLSRQMSSPQPEADAKSAVMLGVASAAFAPIAFLGASSSSLQLCLGFAAAISGILVWHLFKSYYAFASASLFGGAYGMVVVAQTVTLITRKVDLLALTVLGLVFLVPLADSWVLDRLPHQGHRARTVAFAGLCFVPAIVAVAIAYVRYSASLPA
ncbi:hypothetical protein [Microvirga zambiensis]|uniref:hypothetical protein n=1 Tax=Microvirga zambiensis TaxID=1402137 RepID=UPI001920146B|nr:hypothetical protein [Microvirga zambiensis]